MDDADEELIDRAKQQAQSLLSGMRRRWTHARSVGLLAQHLPEDVTYRTPVCLAAWLHDVGYSPLVAQSGLHALDGARWALPEWGSLVASLIAFHTGAEWEARERGLSLAEFAPPPTPALDLLTFLDMTTGPDGDRVKPKDRVNEILNRYQPGSVVHRAVSMSGPALIASAQRGQALAGPHPM